MAEGALGRVRAIAKAHPLWAYFTLAYAISWGAKTRAHGRRTHDLIMTRRSCGSCITKKRDKRTGIGNIGHGRRGLAA